MTVRYLGESPSLVGFSETEQSSLDGIVQLHTIVHSFCLAGMTCRGKELVSRLLEAGTGDPMTFRAPLALAAAAFAAGIWMAGHLQPSPTLWGTASALLAGCAIAAIAKSTARLAQLCATLALVCAGAFARLATPSPNVMLPPPEFTSGDVVEIEGHVTSDGAFLPGSAPRERFDLETESIQLGRRTFTQPVGIRATVFSSDLEMDPVEAATQFPTLGYGDRVHLSARLRLPRNFRNPGAFDYEGYLHGLGISVLASARAQDVKTLPGRSGRWLGFARSRIRRSILEHISDARSGLWPRDDAPLFAAMILGQDSLLLRDVREEFQETGVYHLLVVSGMNVALLALAIFWLARRLRAPEWAAGLVTIVVSLFYAYVAGMGVPIQRAVLMLSVYLVARWLYRERAALNATGFAALVVLALAPGALYNAGFQLTFLALLAIAGISVPVLERTTEPLRRVLQHLASTTYDLNLEPKMAQFRLDLRLIAGRITPLIGETPARWLVTGAVRTALSLFELLVVSSITQAVLVLPMRAYFHRAAIIGLPANILVLPLAGTMLNAGVAAIALSYVPLLRLPARVAAWVAAAALHWTLRWLGWLSLMPVTQWRLPSPNWVIVLAAATGVVFALFAVRKRRGIAWAGVAVLFASAVVVAFYVPSPAVARGKLEITAIDVGQGDSLLVVSPEGRVMLVDGGGAIGPARGEFDFGEDVVSPYLWSRGLAKLDVVALSHAHGDHIGGLKRAIENFHPRELWVGINPETQAVDQLFAAAAANGVAVHRHVTGDELDWGGAHIRVVAPPANWHPKAKPMNDDSLAFLISYGGTSALLAGDLEKRMEKFIASESPRADVLKVAHHGSATSTTEELLGAVRPHFAVISVGYRNSFGHPRPVVLERLRSNHVMTYRTDTQGAITFLLDGKQVEPHVVMEER